MKDKVIAVAGGAGGIGLGQLDYFARTIHLLVISNDQLVLGGEER